jgi:hypothetical protein
MAHSTVTVEPGSSITVTLPNGVTVNIEATVDTIDIVRNDGRVLYAAVKDSDGWANTWPTPHPNE